MVVNKGRVATCLVNIEPNNCHAPANVAERKNTQVIQIRKNVNNAFKILPLSFLLDNGGIIEAVDMTGSGVMSINGDALGRL